MTIKTCYKHKLFKDVFLYLDNVYLEDKKITMYEVEWYSISGYFIGHDRIKIKHEDKHNWELFENGTKI